MGDLIDTAAAAASNVLETGIVGSLLILSLVANVALIIFLIKCFNKRIAHYDSKSHN